MKSEVVTKNKTTFGIAACSMCLSAETTRRRKLLDNSTRNRPSSRNKFANLTYCASKSPKTYARETLKRRMLESTESLFSSDSFQYATIGVKTQRATSSRA